MNKRGNKSRCRGCGGLASFDGALCIRCEEEKQLIEMETGRDFDIDISDNDELAGRQVDNPSNLECGGEG